MSVRHFDFYIGDENGKSVTVSIPHMKVVIIGASNGSFEINLILKNGVEVDGLLNMRVDFGHYYKYGGQYIYVVGGVRKYENTRFCEKYDVFR